jgi:hypothetical protein
MTILPGAGFPREELQVNDWSSLVGAYLRSRRQTLEPTTTAGQRRLTAVEETA